MAFCAWCGNNVPQISYVPCPRCGNPTNGSQRVAQPGSSGKTTGIIVGLIIGGFALVAFIGIVAAIAIPNFMTAMQRSKQKRTMVDMRSVGVGIEAYAAEEGGALPAGEYVEALRASLVPKHLQTLPAVDGWGTALRYECWPAGACEHYAIASAGADRSFEHGSLQDYAADTRTADFNADIVFTDGKFTQHPEEVTRGAGR